VAIEEGGEKTGKSKKKGKQETELET